MKRQKPRNLHISNLAKRDLAQILSYGKREFGIETARQFMQEFSRIFKLLCDPHCRLGTNKDEIMIGLFSFPVKNYVIYFFRYKTEIKIVRVLHGSRLISPNIIASFLAN